jgi:uncharacterized membrane protein
LEITVEIKMKLTRNKIFSGILIFVLIVNLLVIYNFQHLYLGTIFSLVFLIIIPGLLLTLLLKIDNLDFWEYLVYTIGLSIAFLMFVSLAINWILPLFGVAKPLSIIPLLIIFDILFSIFWLIAYKRNKKILIEIKLVKSNLLNKVFLILPIIFPTLSILGANILNNNGPNYLTMIMLGGIATFVFLIVLSRKRLNENIYPWAILMMSISLLLMFSLRSWYIFGSDINQEYQVFQLAKENLHWSIASFRESYNACLSITILPVVFDSFLKINDQYIYKLFFQIIFAFVPVITFIIAKKFTQPILAFIASFFSISFPSFFFIMPMHVREEIALLFFSLIILMLLNKNIVSVYRNILFLIFGFSMVVAHYSTTYIALGILIFTYIVLGLFIFIYLKSSALNKTKDSDSFSKTYERLNLKEMGQNITAQKYFHNILLVLILLFFTFLWINQITKTSGNLIDFTNKTIKNIGNIFSQDVRAEQTSFLDQFNIFYKKKNSEILLQNYIKETYLKHHNDPYITPYSPQNYRDYQPEVLHSKSVPLKVNSDIVSKIYFSIGIINKLIKFFIIVGVIYLLFIYFKKRKIDIEYIFIAIGSLFCLAVTMILPFATISYNITRIYQQVLVILALPAVLGVLIALKFLKKFKISSLVIIFLIYFLFHSGFIPQALGSFEAAPHLNNYGTEYDKLYTYKTEIKAVEWLSSNYSAKSNVNTDMFGKNRLEAFGRKTHFAFGYPIIGPSLIEMDAYVYLTYSNKIKYIGFILTNSEPIGYNFPIEFLDKNKNLIYNNGGSEIFK